jgi:hypothetical protein
MDNIQSLIIAILLGVILGLLVNSSYQRKEHRDIAIKYGIGGYNPTNGNFELKNLK